VPLDDPLLRAIEPSLEKPGRLCLAYDAGAFHADRSGRVEVRLATPQAERIVERLRVLAITRG